MFESHYFDRLVGCIPYPFTSLMFQLDPLTTLIKQLIMLKFEKVLWGINFHCCPFFEIESS